MSDITAGLPASGGSESNSTVTPASEPVSLGAGEALSFDQLDSFQENKTNIPEEKEEKKAKETKVVDKKEETTEKKPEKKAEKKTEKDASVEKAKKDAKLYKVKVGESDIEIAADGSLQIEKDGNTIPVTVQDLVNSYHGTSEIHRRLSQIDVEKKKFESDRKTVDSFVDKIAEFYKADKPLELVDFLVNTAGLDPALYRMKLIESLTPEVESFSSMTPEEKKAYHLNLENQYLRRQQQNITQEQTKQKELSSLESEVTRIRQAHNLDEKQFYALYRELVDVHGKNENELTPQDIADYADRKLVTNHITDQIKSANPDYAEVAELAESLAEELLSNSGLELDDLEEIIREVVQDNSEEELKEKLKTPKKERSTEPKNPSSEPLTFDDLM